MGSLIHYEVYYCQTKFISYTYMFVHTKCKPGRSVKSAITVPEIYALWHCKSVDTCSDTECMRRM